MLDIRDAPSFTLSAQGKIEKGPLLTITWVFFAVALAFFVVRLVIRVKINSKLNIDDGFAALALGILLAHAIILTMMADPMYDIIHLAAGDKTFIPPADFMVRSTFYLKCQFAATMLFWTCLWAVKASFLAFFKKLTEGLKFLSWCWYAIAGFVGLAYVACAVSYPISCTSFQLGACETPRNIYLSLVSLRMSTALDVISDIMIIALPIALVVRVRLNKRTKLALTGVFLMGGVIMVFAIIRIIVTNTQSVHPEVSWLNVWSAIECSIAVIVCCLTVFKQLITSRKVGYSGNTYTPGYGGRSGTGGQGTALGKTMESQVTAIPLTDYRQTHAQNKGHILVTTDFSYTTSERISTEAETRMKTQWRDSDSEERIFPA